MFRELELEEKARADFLGHEEEITDFMEIVDDLKMKLAAIEEKMDLGEDLYPSGDEGPLVSNDRDFEGSTTEGNPKRRRH